PSRCAVRHRRSRRRRAFVGLRAAVTSARPAAAERAAEAVWRERHRIVRRMVLQRGWEPQFSRRLSESEHGAGPRHSDWAEQSNRAWRTGYGPAEPLPART